MPSWDIFEHQTQDYQDSVLPLKVTARIAIERASTFGWERYVGRRGRVIGMHIFGASVPLKELQKKFGFEPDRVVSIAKELLDRDNEHWYAPRPPRPGMRAIGHRPNAWVRWFALGPSGTTSVEGSRNPLKLSAAP
jgi:hypothetical protein